MNIKRIMMLIMMLSSASMWAMERDDKPETFVCALVDSAPEGKRYIAAAGFDNTSSNQWLTKTLYASTALMHINKETEFSNREDLEHKTSLVDNRYLLQSFEKAKEQKFGSERQKLFLASFCETYLSKLLNFVEGKNLKICVGTAALMRAPYPLFPEYSYLLCIFKIGVGATNGATNNDQSINFLKPVQSDTCLSVHQNTIMNSFFYDLSNHSVYHVNNGVWSGAGEEPITSFDNRKWNDTDEWLLEKRPFVLLYSPVEGLEKVINYIVPAINKRGYKLNTAVLGGPLQDKNRSQIKDSALAWLNIPYNDLRYVYEEEFYNTLQQDYGEDVAFAIRNHGSRYLEYPFQKAKPIEDYHTVFQDIATGSSVIGIFDGHGGDQVARELVNAIKELMEQKVGSNWAWSTDRKSIVEVVQEIFLNTNELIQAAVPKTNAGSTALVAFITKNNQLIIANTGDCVAVLSNGDQLTHEHNANHIMKEKQKGKPDDEQLFREYEKERLKKYTLTPVQSIGGFRIAGYQTTRSFGDYNLPRWSEAQSWAPEITILNLGNKKICDTRGSSYIILASDGVISDDLLHGDEACYLVAETLEGNISPTNDLLTSVSRRVLAGAVHKSIQNIIRDVEAKLLAKAQKSIFSDAYTKYDLKNYPYKNNNIDFLLSMNSDAFQEYLNRYRHLSQDNQTVIIKMLPQPLGDSTDQIYFHFGPEQFDGVAQSATRTLTSRTEKNLQPQKPEPTPAPTPQKPAETTPGKPASTPHVVPSTITPPPKTGTVQHEVTPEKKKTEEGPGVFATISKAVGNIVGAIVDSILWIVSFEWVTYFSGQGKK